MVKEKEKHEQEIDLTTPPEGYTPEEWAMLSKEEQEGIVSPLTEAEAGKIPAKEVKDKEPPKKEEPSPEKTPEEIAAEEAAKKEKESGAEEEEIPDGDGFAPIYDLKVENFEELEEAAKEDLKELKSQYDAGDIPIDEWLEARDEIRDELNRLKLEDSISGKINAQTNEQLWERDQATFFSMNPDFVVPREGATEQNIILNAALDGAVKSLANRPENADKTGIWVLYQAKKMVQKSMGITPTASEQSEEEEINRLAAQEKALKKVPKTLKDTPPAQEEIGSEDEFASLDKLEGIELEKALALLPESKRDQYLATA